MNRKRRLVGLNLNLDDTFFLWKGLIFADLDERRRRKEAFRLILTETKARIGGQKKPERFF